MKITLFNLRHFWLWHIRMMMASAFGGGYLREVTKQRDLANLRLAKLGYVTTEDFEAIDKRPLE